MDEYWSQLIDAAQNGQNQAQQQNSEHRATYQRACKELDEQVKVS